MEKETTSQETEDAVETENENLEQDSQPVDETQPPEGGEEIDKDQTIAELTETKNKLEKALSNRDDNIPRLRAQAEKVPELETRLNELQQKLDSLKSIDQSQEPETLEGYDADEIRKLRKVLGIDKFVSKADIEAKSKETQIQIDYKCSENIRNKHPELYDATNNVKFRKALKDYVWPENNEEELMRVFEKAYNDAFGDNKNLIEQGANKARAQDKTNRMLQVGGGGTQSQNARSNEYEEWKKVNPMSTVTKKQFEKTLSEIEKI